MRLEIRQSYHKTNDLDVNDLDTNAREILEKSTGRSLGNMNSSYYFIMIKIATYLDVNLNSRERKVKDRIYNSFIVTASSQKSLDIMREYLDRYPLLSSSAPSNISSSPAF